MEAKDKDWEISARTSLAPPMPNKYALVVLNKILKC